LLKAKVLKRWCDNVARGSVITADVYLRRLGHFCNEVKTTPNMLLEMKEDEFYDLFLDTVSIMEKKGHSGSYIHSTLKAIKSWLLNNRIQVRNRKNVPAFSRVLEVLNFSKFLITWIGLKLLMVEG